MITIKDVAKHAGVSVTSASYALNDTGTISEETRKRVLNAAEELNYHPNAFARNLKNRKTRTIGVFISRFGGSFYEDILSGIHETVLNTDYELIVVPESRAARRHLTHRQNDAAIVFDSKIKSEVILRLASEQYPIVILDRYLAANYLYPILVDNIKGAQEVFDHLYNQGVRRMVYVAGAQDSYDNYERKMAFFAAAADHGLDVPIYEGNFTEQSGCEAANAIYDAGPLPEAVFCANDQMAIGLMRALQERQVHIPADVAVVGFDDIQISPYLRPSLTTVGASRYTWGALAARQIIEFLENGKTIEPVRIPVRLMQRESSVVRSTSQHQGR